MTRREIKRGSFYECRTGGTHRLVTAVYPDIVFFITVRRWKSRKDQGFTSGHSGIKAFVQWTRGEVGNGKLSS